MAGDRLSVSMTTCAAIIIESNARTQDRGDEIVDEWATSERTSRRCNGITGDIVLVACVQLVDTIGRKRYCVSSCQPSLLFPGSLLSLSLIYAVERLERESALLKLCLMIVVYDGETAIPIPQSALRD
jgi:hypothetical protein